MPRDLLAVLRGELLDEIVDQDGNVLAPLAERGQADRDHLQPVVEVAAERARLDRLLQVAIGGREDADVDLDRLVRADAGDLAVFQHPQQLDLRGQGHVAHLVEEHRAAVGVFELAHPIGRGVGKRALHVAEQLALQNVLAQRGAVQGHEGLVLPRAVLVDGLGDQLLAGARLALDQHAGVGRGDAFQPLDHVVHLRAVADDALEAELFVQPPLQFQVGLLAAASSPRPFPRSPEAGRRRAA